MRLNSHLHQLVISILLAGMWILSSCDTFDEKLPECRLYIKFIYDYNVDSADAFHSQVQEVDLYVFDNEGKFVMKQSDQGAPLTTGSYLMEVPLPVGKYQFMAWAKAGVYDASGNQIAAPAYEIPTFTPGVTTIQEMKLKLERDPSLIINKELEALWYGEIEQVDFTGRTHQTDTINLIKDTNKIRFLFQGNTPEWTIDVDEYEYEILEANGYMDYDNSLLTDDMLRYHPYYTNQEEPQLAVIEMNMMRLMANRVSRFIVTEKATGKQVFNINLTKYLILTEMIGYKWSDQEYLDRQDEYVIVFFFSNPDDSGNWFSPRIQVNEWTWYVQHEDI